MRSIEEQREHVEAIKLSLMSMRFHNLSAKKTLRLSIENLYNCFEASGNKEYLEAALFHIQVHLELGFMYEDEEELFNRILSELHTDRNTEFPKRFYNSYRTTLNKAQVRRMIGRWTPSKYRTAPINEVVNDIIKKVKEHKNGIYKYYCQIGTDTPKDEYELFISDEECFFHDVIQNRYFTFKNF